MDCLWAGLAYCALHHGQFQMTSSNPEKLFALLPEAEKEAANNPTMALYQLSKQSALLAFRIDDL